MEAFLGQLRTSLTDALRMAPAHPPIPSPAARRLSEGPIGILALRFGRGAYGFGVGLVRWAPVWVPILLIWLLTERGLKPALAEQRRLEAAQPTVEERNERTQREYERLSAQRRAWDDPLFQERVRREKAKAAEERRERAAGGAAAPR